MSSTEQALGTSLQDQQNSIAAYVAGLGLKVARFFVEAESGIGEKIERREQMRLLMADAREGDLVVCDKLDRWSRDPEFTHASTRQIHERGGSFYAVADRCDPSTHEGAMMMGFKVVMAQDENRRIRERMVGTRKLLRNHGYYVEGLPPLGYRRAHPKGYKGAEKNALVIDEPRAELVRSAFRMCIAGSPVAAIGEALGLEKSRVAKVLRTRAYVGEIQDSRGEWIRAKHPGIVDADTFTRARAAVDGRRLGGPRPRSGAVATSGWILRDVALCATCGARMGAAYGYKQTAQRFYYRCPGGCLPYVRVDAIEAAAAPLVIARLAELREELAREPPPESRVEVQDFAARRETLARKRGRIADAFADGGLDREGMRARLAKLDAEGLRLDGEERAVAKGNPLASAEVRRSTLAAVELIAKGWRKASPEVRRGIVGRLAKGARIGSGSVSFTWRTAEEMAEQE